MNFIDQWLNELIGATDTEPNHAATLYELMVP